MVNEDYIYSEIGKRIREAREKKGLTQQELGDLVDLTRTSITNIERGKQKIQIDGLYRFAYSLGVSAFDFLPNEGFPSDDIVLPGDEEKFKDIEPEALSFAKRVLEKYRRNEGEQ